jgi:hypothetical protein
MSQMCGNFHQNQTTQTNLKQQDEKVSIFPRHEHSCLPHLGLTRIGGLAALTLVVPL